MRYCSLVAFHELSFAPKALNTKVLSMSPQRKQNVLVFPCGSEIGLELYRSLSTSTHVMLWGGSSVPDHGEFVYERYIEGLPYVTDPMFIDAVNHVVDENAIDFLFSAHDSVVLSFAENAKQLHCRVLGSPIETCRICRSKRLTCKTFASLLRVPILYDDLDRARNCPLFLKPDIGQGSRGTYLVRDRKEAEFYLAQDPSLLPLEYLPGTEYTIDCFTDRHGDLRFAGARERTRIQNGISVHTRPVNHPAFQEMARTINATLAFRGAWFFQVKKTVDGELALMEIAPRVAGTMALYRNLGVNFALLTVFDAMGFDVSILCNKYHLELDRALAARFKAEIDYQHLYIDLDDCLVRENKVNPLAVALLYQCLNRNIQLHLLTRHASAVDATLKRHRLKGLFDEVVHLKSNDLKSAYIREKKSIFIDDSFAEREEVKDVRGIPVFAPDAIECLFE